MNAARDPKGMIGGATKLGERAGDEAYFAAVSVRRGMWARAASPNRAAGSGFQRYGLLGGAVAAGGRRRRANRDHRRAGELSYKELDENQRAGQRVARPGLEPAGRGHPGAQPPGLPRGGVRRGQVRRVDHPAQHIVRRPADPRGGHTGGHRPAGLRRGVRGCWGTSILPGPLRLGDEPGGDTLDSLIEGGDPSAPPKPPRPKITILTSGTTGTPKGAPRGEPKSLWLMGGLLSKVPFRAEEVTELCVPMFHALGFLRRWSASASGRRSSCVAGSIPRPRSQRREAPSHRDGGRPGDAPADRGPREEGSRRDTSALRIIFVSGSALGADLAKRSMKAFGPVVYNLYGSTEVAYATIATPEDLRATARRARSCVARWSRCSTSRATRCPGGDGPDLRRQHRAVRGLHGRREQGEVEGLMSSGDVGHFDEKGRLFIDGRDDEMIVSGGENVFPAEVEELLAGTRRSPRRRRRGGGPAVRTAVEGVRRRAEATLSEDESRATSRRTSPATRRLGRSFSSRSCRGTRPGRCSSESSTASRAGSDAKPEADADAKPETDTDAEPDAENETSTS